MGVVKKYLTIHAHFYQPKRTDPWENFVLENTGEKNYKNYNFLIIDQCYGPLSIKEIKVKDELINIYSLINYNFGPTLLNFIEENDPQLYYSIIESDIISQKIYGYGNAIACVYNHAILPLLPLNHKKLYIRWGIENFKRNFKRQPLGMWLSELAVDEQTLEVLIENDIKFIILSPHQIESIKNIKTQKIENIVNPSIPYLWRSKQNPQKTITIFLYNKEISNKIIHEANNTEKFSLRIKTSIDINKKNTEFVLLASDGENWGYHLKNGDIYLKKLIEYFIRHKKEMELANLSFLYHTIKPEYEIEIKNNSSWSCPHGIERWKCECGCRIDTKNNYQKWKHTLKKTIDNISEKVDDLFIKETSSYIKNPYSAIEEFINIYEEKSPHQTLSFIEKNSIKKINPDDIPKILKLFDMKLHLAFAYTSCGWFFDDITNIETLNNIKNIIYIVDILKKYAININIDEIENEKSNFKQINFKETIKEIKKLIYSKEKQISEFIILDLIDYKNIFYKSRYHLKIINKQIDNNSINYTIKLSDIITLNEETYNAALLNEKGNIIIKIKKGNETDYTIITLQDINPQIKALFTTLKSNDKSKTELKQFYYSIIHINENSYLELLKKFNYIVSSNNDIPFLYEISKILLSNILTYNIDKKIIDDFSNTLKKIGIEISWKLKIGEKK